MIQILLYSNESVYNYIYIYMWSCLLENPSRALHEVTITLKFYGNFQVSISVIIEFKIFD